VRPICDAGERGSWQNLAMNFVPDCPKHIRFREAENIKRALDGELYFYSRLFGFERADGVEPVSIENL